MRITGFLGLWASKKDKLLENSFILMFFGGGKKKTPEKGLEPSTINLKG